MLTADVSNSRDMLATQGDCSRADDLARAMYGAKVPSVRRNLPDLHFRVGGMKEYTPLHCKIHLLARILRNGRGGVYNETARSARRAQGKEGWFLQRHGPGENVAGRAYANDQFRQVL